VKKGRVWLFRLLALTLVPLVLLGAVELLLRVAGSGRSTAFFQKTSINGVDCLVENPRFGLRFFPAEMARSPAPVVMGAVKPPGRYRIFLLGESAALGDPAPAFGFGRYLEVLLRERFPKSDFEIICVAMTAINSHAILPIAQECAGHEGDMWLLYMGNNEMVGPFGAATVFGAKAPPLWQVRLTLALKQSRIVQAMAGLREKWRGDQGRQTWEGMKMFMGNRIPPDDARRETVHRNFRSNLSDILATGYNNRTTAHYCVPAGYTGYLTTGVITTGQATGSTSVTAFLKQHGPDGILRVGAVSTLNNGSVQYDFTYPYIIPEKNCVGATAVGTAANNSASAYFNIVLVKNTGV
jgi:hypothetical protein